VIRDVLSQDVMMHCDPSQHPEAMPSTDYFYSCYITNVYGLTEPSVIVIGLRRIMVITVYGIQYAHVIVKSGPKIYSLKVTSKC